MTLGAEVSGRSMHSLLLRLLDFPWSASMSSLWWLLVKREVCVRANGIAILLGFILVALCAPLAAQSSRPIYLYSLETNGAGAPPLHAFTMNSLTGALSEIPGSPFSVGSNPCCIAVDPTGRFIYVVNSSSNDITGFSVNASTGILTPLPGSPFVTGNNPVSLAIDPTGRFLYVPAYTIMSLGLKSSYVYE